MSRKIRVLVVDDSAFARNALSRNITADPDIEVIGEAGDGVEAIEKVRDMRPDVVTMDVIMPRMDGLTALQHILESYPTAVIMVSALTGKQTNATMKALELGAVDFFLKASRVNPAGHDQATDDLPVKIKQAAQVHRIRLGLRKGSPKLRQNPVPASTAHAGTLNKVITIGSSTGGPRALHEFLPGLPGNIGAGMLIVQHMPPGFTHSLAERLDKVCSIHVREAEDGDSVQAGVALIAPGGYHMTVSRKGKISFNQDPPVCGVRPSVDVLMESAAKAYRNSTVGVVLTGMGSDGTHGAGLIKAAGGKVMVEDESTCAIYGMPKSIVDAGYADMTTPLSEIAEELVRICES